MPLIVRGEIDLASTQLLKRIPMLNEEGVEVKKLVADLAGLIVGVSFEKQTVTGVDDSANTFTVANHTYKTGVSVWLTTDDTLPMPLEARTKYFVRVIDENTFQLHSSRADAENDVDVIDLTDVGTGTHIVEIVITEPNDFGIGAIANVIEWNRRLGRNLIEQLDISNVENRIIPLDAILDDFFNVSRILGERDELYSDRAIDNLLKYPRVAEPGIIDGVRRYDPDVIAIGGRRSAMHCDFSYCDFYSNGVIDDEQVFSAILGGTGGLAYTFILLLSDVSDEDLSKIISFINAAKAAGINWIIYVD